MRLSRCKYWPAICRESRLFHANNISKVPTCLPKITQLFPQQPKRGTRMAHEVQHTFKLIQFGKTRLVMNARRSDPSRLKQFLILSTRRPCPTYYSKFNLSLRHYYICLMWFFLYLAYQETAFYKGVSSASQGVCACHHHQPSKRCPGDNPNLICTNAFHSARYPRMSGSPLKA